MRTQPNAHANHSPRRHASNARRDRSAHAFTLLEIIVAISIILLLFAIATPPALNLVERQRFAAAADAVAHAALDTRSLAIREGKAFQLVYRWNESDALPTPAATAGDRRNSDAVLPVDTTSEIHRGGRLIARPFDPAANPTLAPASFEGIEGVPSRSDFAIDPTADDRVLAEFERNIRCVLPEEDTAAIADEFTAPRALAPGDPAATEEPRPDPPTSVQEPAWWQVGLYDANEAPILVAGPDGSLLFSRTFRVETGDRSATLRFHPLSAEVIPKEPNRDTDQQSVSPRSPSDPLESFSGTSPPIGEDSP